MNKIITLENLTKFKDKFNLQKQDKIDNALQTTNKGIVSAINELKTDSVQMATELESVKQSGVDVKGKIVTSINSKITVPDVTVNDSWDTINQRIKDIKEGQGTAIAGHVLAPYTFTNDSGTLITGTMTNRGAENGLIVTQGGSYTIPAGYHSGLGKVRADLPAQGAQTITPGTTDKTIPAGKYLSGIQTIKGDANLIAGNIASGKTIFGVPGWFSGNANVISIQRGVASLFATDQLKTINLSPINLNSTIVKINTTICQSGAGANAMYCELKGTNTAPILEIKRTASSINENNFIKCYWEVIEFSSEVSVQKGVGTVNYTESSPKTVSISAIDLNKSMLFFTSGGGRTDPYYASADSVIAELFSNNITISFTKTDYNKPFSWFVATFK